jgi:hypothetical protein
MTLNVFMGAYDAIAIDSCKPLCNRYLLNQTGNPTGEKAGKFKISMQSPIRNGFKRYHAASIPDER